MKKIGIIGAGPAGLACATQLKRFGYTPLLFDAEGYNSLLRNANLVENYPGFPHGIGGPELWSLMRKQTEKLGVQIKHETIQRLAWKNHIFHLETSDTSYEADICVLATGTQPITVGKYHLHHDLTGRIFYEVYDLKGQSELDIGIIGAGDAAFDYALNLASASNKVRIFNRGTKIKSLQLLVDRTRNHPSIQYFEKHCLKNILPSTEKNHAIKVIFDVENSDVSMSMDCIIFAAGRNARLELLDSFTDRETATLMKEQKLFIIGDAANGRYRQISIATGDGIRAAMQIHSENSAAN